MGMFDFIGDALGAVASPFTAVIDAGAKLLGLPPALTDALKVAVGAVTGDVFTAVDGGLHLLKDLGGAPAETEYAPAAKDEAFGGTDGWAPAAASSPDAARADATAATDATEDADAPEGADAPEATDASDAPEAVARDLTTDIPRAGGDAADVDEDTAEDIACLETFRTAFDALNHDHGVFGWFGDKVITEKEIRETAESPDAPLDLKKAARHLMDHPELMEKVLRSKDGGDTGIARGDLDLALQELRAGQGGSSAPSAGTGGTSRGPAAVGAKETEQVSALRTLLARFDALNAAHGFLDALQDSKKVLTRRELERAAQDPDSDPALKKAARWMLDHPQVLARASASRANGVQGMSRNDLLLAIQDAETAGGGAPGRVGGSTGTGTAKTPRPSTGHGTSSSGATSSKKTSSRGGKDPSIAEILNDRSLSPEEKIEMILMVLENRADDDMVAVAKKMDTNDDKKTNKDDRKKQTQLDKVDRDLNFKMERLMKRKEQLSNLLSTMEMKFASMAQTAIANMGR